MSFEPPAGILDIGNATLRVGKLEVSETAGLNQGLQNIVKNDLLITEKETYLANKTWGIKLPTAWVGEFDLKTHDNKYVEFNFYNEGSTSNALGYTLNFKDTTLTLKYDNGNTLASETIPDVSTSTYKKVNVFFERGVIAVFIDGARVLYFKESDTYNSVHGHPGMASRVASTTGGSFVNIFIEEDGSDSAVKDLRIVNGRFISDKTSNVSFIGSLGVGVNNPKESLDIRGNMHLTRVSNVSQVSVDSNVVTEYTGPHDRPLRKYPEVAMATGQGDGYTQDGYTVEESSNYGAASHKLSNAFDHKTGSVSSGDSWLSGQNTYANDGTALNASSPDTFQSIKGSWIGIRLPKKIKLSHIHLYNFDFGTTTNRPPKTGIVWASNNSGSSWNRINDFSCANQARNGLNAVNVNSTIYYDWYRVQITEMVIDGSYTNAVSLQEVEFYGYEEGSGSLDTTLKTVYNVPATTGTQLEVYYDAKDLADGNAPTNPVDLSPNTNNATLGGDPQVSNGAFVFDGSGDAVISGATSFSGSPTLSYSVWFKTNSILSGTGSNSIVMIGHAASTKSLGFRIKGTGDTNPGNYRFYVYGGATNESVETGIAAVLGRWTHATIVRDGLNMKLYIDGKFADENTNTTTTLNLDSSAKVALGNYIDSSGTVTTISANDSYDGSIANFRLYSKALNAGQVQELYDYQKDYFLGSKSQLTLYKGHLGVGVTEPSGQLELAGDERIQEYPPGPLTNYDTNIPGHGVFTVYASTDGVNPSYAAWKAFNDVVDGLGWHDVGVPYTNGYYTGTQSLAGIKGEWIALKLPYAINLKSAATAPRSDANQFVARGVGAGVILGSNDGNNWDQLHSFSGLTATDYTFAYINNITAPGYYTTFALLVTELAGSDVSLNISEIKFFGTPGPTTLDKGSLTLGRSLDVPRVSRYDVDTETPRPEKLVLDFDTTVNSSPTDISGQGNHGTFYGTDMKYSPADKAFVFNGSDDYLDIPSVSGVGTGAWVHSKSFWFKLHSSTDAGVIFLLGRNGGTKQIAVQSNGSGQFQYYIYGCSSKVQVNGSDWFPDVNRWYHCVTVFKNNETTATGGVITGREMYIDGVKQTLIATNTQVALNLDSSQVRFGNQFNSIYLDFELSNPKIYSVALEPSEVKKLYNLGRTGRSMVISDTAVGIGKVPEAQLDVRGSLNVTGNFNGNSPLKFYRFRLNLPLNNTGTSYIRRNDISAGFPSDYDDTKIISISSVIYNTNGDVVMGQSEDTTWQHSIYSIPLHSGSSNAGLVIYQKGANVQSDNNGDRRLEVLVVTY